MLLFLFSSHISSALLWNQSGQSLVPQLVLQVLANLGLPVEKQVFGYGIVAVIYMSINQNTIDELEGSFCFYLWSR